MSSSSSSSVQHVETYTASGGFFTNYTSIENRSAVGVQNADSFHTYGTVEVLATLQRHDYSETIANSYNEEGAFNYHTYSNSYSFSHGLTAHPDEGDGVTETNTDSGGDDGTLAAVTTTMAVSTLAESTSFYTISSTATASITKFVSTMVSGVHSYTTATRATSTIANNSDDDFFTDSSTYQTTVASNQTFTITAPIELRTVFSREGANEWCWRPDFTPATALQNNTAGDKFTAVAVSFDQTTIWPVHDSSVVAFGLVGGDAETSLFSARVSSTQEITFAFSTVDGTSVATTTAGNNFSRQTTTVTVPNVTTTTSTSLLSTDAGEFAALATSTAFVRGQSVKTAALPGVFATDGVNKSSFAQLTTYGEFFTETVIVPHGDIVTSSFSSSFADDHLTIQEEWRQAINSTRTFYLAPWIAQPTDVDDDIYSPPLKGGLVAVPFSRGFLHPGADIAASPLAATNLNADDIYYPFTSSVREGVVVPVIYTDGTSAKDGETTWRYQWDTEGNLSYTSISPETSNSATVEFVTVGIHTDCYADDGGNSVWGGFGVNGEAAETIARSPDRMMLFKYGTNVAVTTEDNLVTAFFTSSQDSEYIYVETNLPWGISQVLFQAPPEIRTFQRHRNALT